MSEKQQKSRRSSCPPRGVSGGDGKCRRRFRKNAGDDDGIVADGNGETPIIVVAVVVVVVDRDGGKSRADAETADAAVAAGRRSALEKQQRAARTPTPTLRRGSGPSMGRRLVRDVDENGDGEEEEEEEEEARGFAIAAAAIIVARRR